MEPQSRDVHWLGIKQQHFGLQDSIPTNWATSPGLEIQFKTQIWSDHLALGNKESINKPGQKNSYLHRKKYSYRDKNSRSWRAQSTWSHPKYEKNKVKWCIKRKKLRMWAANLNYRINGYWLNCKEML